MSDSVWRLPLGGTNVAVLANCQIRDDGPQFPPALLPRLQGADLIVTLGGMGAKSALDQLEEVAPVLGVRGTEDAEDMRTRRNALVLTGEGYRIGCVSDAKAAGLSTSVQPFIPTADAARVCNTLFGGPVHILLHATTMQHDEAKFGNDARALNPGCAAPLDPASIPTFLRLKVTPDGCYGQIINAV